MWSRILDIVQWLGVGVVVVVVVVVVVACSPTRSSAIGNIMLHRAISFVAPDDEITFQREWAQ